MTEPYRNPNPTDVPHAASGAAGGVSALVEAGLPLESGLRALAEEAPSWRLSRNLRHMSDELAAGADADVVLSRSGGGLSEYVRGLVRAGIQTGQLGTFLEEFLLAVRRRRAARQGFWLAMAYPLLLIPLSMLAAGGLVSLLVPQFKDMFNDFGVELPSITILIINVGEFFSPPVLFGFLTLVVGLQLVWMALPYLFGPAVWTRFVQALPVVGVPSRMRGMSEFCSFLGLLVSGGIPLPEALEITSEALQDANLRAGARKLAGRVRSGQSMQEGAGHLPHFSDELRSLFHWETRGTTFGEMLRQAGRVFAARSQVQLGIVGLIFQPLILLFVGGVVAFTVIALFMPLIRLLNELS